MIEFVHSLLHQSQHVRRDSGSKIVSVTLSSDLWKVNVVAEGKLYDPDQHVILKYKQGWWSGLREKFLCTVNNAKSRIGAAYASKMKQAVALEPIMPIYFKAFASFVKEHPQPRCHKDLSLRKDLFIAILKADPDRDPQRILTFKWEKPDGTRVYTRSLYYHMTDHTSSYASTFKNDRIRLGPTVGEISYRNLTLLDQLPRKQRVHFDFGRLISEIPPLVYDALLKSLMEKVKTDYRKTFECMEHKRVKWPIIEIELKPFAGPYYITSDEYILEMPKAERASKAFQGKCFLAIVPNKNGDNGKWTIGATFAKRYFMEMRDKPEIK
uniref:AlNc14C2G313 protein n=1 Tax=Albugo laibachii Nc14 TaxID=890382 RepID=F0VZH5_9STRA|nr:AlNc14C2G313 [Albugo laibachii Nc14]|eukprot:CCA14205.1 AlNc14C2G313 [Albugo laibachii Nc14]